MLVYGFVARIKKIKMNKAVVIFYHKNIEAIYRREWIHQCIDSIMKQTFQDFDVIELNYGGNNKFYYPDQAGKNISRMNEEMPNHTYAMNHVIDAAFKLGYEIVFNTNMDDTYHPLRFIKQYQKINAGYQLVSSNFWYTNQHGLKFKKMNMTGTGNIEINLLKNHNVIAHPCVAMHKSFWSDGLRYKDLLGYEDLDLWKRAVAEKKKFFILDDYLLNYRLHGKQVTKKYRGK